MTDAGRHLVEVVASVIIPVHDAAATLGEQLAALAGQVDAPEFEVVVVLNRCSDASRAVAEGFDRVLRLTVLEANGAASAAHARNAGVAASTGSCLLFCDADDRVGPSWVTEMARALRAGQVDLVGGTITVDREGLPNWIYELRYRRIDGACTQQSGAGFAYVIGASLGCLRASFEGVGGFDEAFVGAAGEEMDLAARLLRAGCRIGEAPDAHLTYRPRTSMLGVLRQSCAYEKGWAIFAAKDGRLTAPASRTAVIARVVKRVGYLVVRHREWRPQVLIFHASRSLCRARAERAVAARADGEASRLGLQPRI